MAERKKVAVVAGAGPGHGAALAKRFAQAGYAVAMLARSQDTLDALENEIDGARGYACDIASPDEVAKTFAAIRADLGEVDALLYNAGPGVFGDVENTSPEALEQSWRVNAYGLMLCSKQVVPGMRKAGGGAIVITGATASRRGGPVTLAFAAAKAAQRSMAESMAKSLWRDGIHVCLIIVDGVFDIPKAREAMPDKPDAFFINPDATAETAYQLAIQDRSSWSFEVEARPFGEHW
ncbi:MAG TPA: SDR family NAD(P)-dependent oxidoreductase [Caulobacteraceae bacterium]